MVDFTIRVTGDAPLAPQIAEIVQIDMARWGREQHKAISGARASPEAREGI
jgi:hypothetical protein